ncbi:CPBP family intramembrane glutamic endopeptidase [Butyrivibrio sp. TB]|jgi:membrane protease YdiL (CAAX protease family)|uniref:CPBP family intramembrane glutamic endopeptidase n=1 Tax=Butyrivibrio sp. TB TaxID=1520809 RepID=UPI0008CEF9F5|nr:CPBP family intramembrane glutamic endopeptidase [Butyrivibrio sp. TB]SEQ33995.1 CAAX protease self-immunity [Butyrivibrio sp. TB]
MLKKYIDFMKRSPLITAALCIVYVVVCFKTVHTDTNFQFFIVRTMLCGAVCFFLYQISGDKTLTSCYVSTGYVIKNSIGFLAMSLIMGLVLLISNIEEQVPLKDNPVLGFIVIFLMFMSVGLFEELAFRAVINDAIIYKFREKKYVFVLSAVVSSIVFGAVHIVGEFDVTSPIAWGQAVAKTLESGVFGLALLILYWKTRNVWAIGVTHGLFDFLAGFTDGLFVSVGKSGSSYINTGEDGVRILITYFAIAAINAVLTFIVWKKVGKTIDFEKIRREW